MLRVLQGSDLSPSLRSHELRSAYFGVVSFLPVQEEQGNELRAQLD